MHDRYFDLTTEKERPYAFIQWKGGLMFVWTSTVLAVNTTTSMVSLFMR
jgi:hypothetical protein